MFYVLKVAGSEDHEGQLTRICDMRNRNGFANTYIYEMTGECMGR
jgi:hypothetical protein